MPYDAQQLMRSSRPQPVELLTHGEPGWPDGKECIVLEIRDEISRDRRGRVSGQGPLARQRLIDCARQF